MRIGHVEWPDGPIFVGICLSCASLQRSYVDPALGDDSRSYHFEYFHPDSPREDDVSRNTTPQDPQARRETDVVYGHLALASVGIET